MMHPPIANSPSSMNGLELRLKHLRLSLTVAVILCCVVMAVLLFLMLTDKWNFMLGGF